MAKQPITAKAGECAYEDNGTVFVFVTPSLDDYEDYQEKIVGVKRRGPFMRELAQKCLKDQTQLPALQKLFERKPALALVFANALQDLAGIEAEIVVGKD